MCYATELDSYKDQLHQSAAEKDELARRNQRFQAALTDTVQIIYWSLISCQHLAVRLSFMSKIPEVWLSADEV